MRAWIRKKPLRWLCNDLLAKRKKRGKKNTNNVEKKKINKWREQIHDIFHYWTVLRKKKTAFICCKQTNSNNNNKQPVVCLWSNKKHRKGKTKTLGDNSQSSRKRVEKQKEAHEKKKTNFSTDESHASAWNAFFLLLLLFVCLSAVKKKDLWQESMNFVHKKKRA